MSNISNRPSVADLYRHLFAHIDAATFALKSANSLVLRIGSLSGNPEVQKIVEERANRKP